MEYQCSQCYMECEGVPIEDDQFNQYCSLECKEEHLTRLKKVNDLLTRARKADVRINPLDVQEGGSHYKICKIQPIEYMYANNLNYAEGAIVKYITRHRNKGKAEDIRKIKHFCDFILKFEYNEE